MVNPCLAWSFCSTQSQGERTMEEDQVCVHVVQTKTKTMAAVCTSQAICFEHKLID